eukprot:COSAG01_NODE_4099_length_5352_cov_2.528841_2_plen_234_part_00
MASLDAHLSTRVSKGAEPSVDAATLARLWKAVFGALDKLRGATKMSRPPSGERAADDEPGGAEVSQRLHERFVPAAILAARAACSYISTRDILRVFAHARNELSILEDNEEEEEKEEEEEEEEEEETLEMQDPSGALLKKTTAHRGDVLGLGQLGHRLQGELLQHSCALAHMVRLCQVSPTQLTNTPRPTDKNAPRVLNPFRSGEQPRGREWQRGAAATGGAHDGCDRHPDGR